MPFNRVNNTKALNLWLLLLSSSNKKDDDAPSNDDTLNSKPAAQLLPGWWMPGLMVVPLPQAGCILGYWDMGYWAALFYVLGSIVYVVDSFYLWPYFYSDSNDDPADPGVYLNTLAAALFVINALLCFLDWYMQREQLSVMNMIVDENITGGFQLQSISTKITWYYFFNNFFFLGAATVYLIQSFWEEDPRTDLKHCSIGFCGNFWINFWGTFLYTLSSFFAYLEYLEDARIREQQGLPPLTLLPYSWDSFDWFGWGDILYIFTSVLQLVQSFFMFSAAINDDFYNGWYLNSNIFFLIDSLAYYIGYVIFLYDMRNALYSGQIPLKQTGAISELIGDAVDDTTSFSDVGGQRPSLFRRVEHGFVTIDEIREKLITAKEIRAQRASEMSHRGTDHSVSRGSRLTAVQNPIIQRGRSDNNLERLSRHQESRRENDIL